MIFTTLPKICRNFCCPLCCGCDADCRTSAGAGQLLSGRWLLKKMDLRWQRRSRLRSCECATGDLHPSTNSADGQRHHRNPRKKTTGILYATSVKEKKSEHRKIEMALSSQGRNRKKSVGNEIPDTDVGFKSSTKNGSEKGPFKAFHLCNFPSLLELSSSSEES